jgi:hypothetical protein
MEKTIELTHEDRARLARLYEEAAGRLYEAALLISRNVGLKGELTGFQFDHSRKVRTPTEPEAAAQGTRAVAALVRFVTVGHRVYVIADSGCGYYDFDTGVCACAPCF